MNCYLPTYIILLYEKLDLAFRDGQSTEHARIPARSDQNLGCSERSIPELLQFEHVRARSVLEP